MTMENNKPQARNLSRSYYIINCGEINAFESTVAIQLKFQIQDLRRGYYVVYKHTTPILYCSQEVLLFSRGLE